MFCRVDDTIWGLYEEREGWRVLFIEDEATSLTRHRHPVAEGEYSAIEPLPAHVIHFSTIITLPSSHVMQHACYLTIRDVCSSNDGALPHDEAAALREASSLDRAIAVLRDATLVDPRHYLLGYAWSVQESVEAECAQHSQNIRLSDRPDVYEAQLMMIEADEADWQFLLQLDTDERIGLSWGDVGTMYLCIRRRHLAEHNFAGTWAVMQSY